MAVNLENDSDTNGDWLDKMACEIDQTFDFRKGRERQNRFKRARTKGNEEDMIEKEQSDDVENLLNAAEETAKERQEATFDELVDTFEKNFDADLSQKMRKQETTWSDIDELQNNFFGVKEEIVEGNQNDYDDTVIKIEKTVDEDYLGDSNRHSYIKEETLDDVTQEGGSLDDGYVYKEQGPAVIVERVSDVIVEINGDSLETIDHERTQLVTGPDESAVSKTIEHSYAQNTEIWQNVLDDVTNMAAAARSARPKRQEKAKKRQTNKGQQVTAKTCRHLHNKLACNLCSYNGRVGRNIKRQMRFRGRKKQHACMFCEYTTPHSAALKIHIRRHTGEKPYACDVCNYRTSQKCHLNTHVLSHSDEKPIACKICPYRTKTKSHLTSHMKIHIRSPFVCKLCDYAYDSSRKLKNHQQVLH